MTAPAALRDRLGRFAAVGIAAALVYAVLAWLLTVVAGLPATVASFVAFGVAALCSYLGQRQMTFRSDRPHREAAPRFLGLTLVGYAIVIAAPLVFTDMLGADPLVAIVVASTLVPVVNYLGLERIVFAVNRAKLPRA